MRQTETRSETERRWDNTAGQLLRCFSFGQGTPLTAEYLSSVYSLAVPITAWELVLWIIRTCWRMEGLRIPLALTIATRRWAYGVVTITFSEMENPKTGETVNVTDGMLSPILLKATIRGTERNGTGPGKSRPEPF